MKLRGRKSLKNYDDGAEKADLGPESDSSSDSEDSDIESDEDLKEMARKVGSVFQDKLGLTAGKSKQSQKTKTSKSTQGNSHEISTITDLRNLGFVIDRVPTKTDKLPMTAKNKRMPESSFQDSDTTSDSDDSDTDSGSETEDKESTVATGSKTAETDNRAKHRSRTDERSELSSSLKSTLDMNDGYIDVDAPHKQNSRIDKLKKNKNEELMKKSVLTQDFENKHTVPKYEETFRQLKKQRKAKREKTKGKKWFDLPAQEMTEEQKNDLMVLHMRRALDPKRFYKAPDMRALPKYFQTGTVVESAADFYHSRVPKKQRKATLVDELMADAEFRKYNKRKYAEIMEAKQHSKGAFRHAKRLKKKKK